MGKHLVFRILATGLSLLFLFIFLELVVLITRIDLMLLRHNLFYSTSDPEVYQQRADPHLLYAPRPGAQYESTLSIHPLEQINKAKRIVNINAHGFRSPSWPKKKAEGVFRIFFFGGSNTYGLSVSDEQTYPWQLQKLLDQKSPGKYEIWNGGITASVLSQKIAYAEYAIQNFEPDLIIIQDFINVGRRPFLSSSNEVPPFDRAYLADVFSQDPDLYLENIPFVSADSPWILQLHDGLLPRWGGYRLMQITWNFLTNRFQFPNHQYGDCRSKYSICGRLGQKYSEWGEILNAKRLRSFVAQHRELPIFLYDPLGDKFCGSGLQVDRSAPVIANCFKDRPPEFYVPHPPSYVYADHAKRLVQFVLHEASVKN